MSLDLNRPIILYMHAGSGNHGCEAIVDSTLRLIERIRKEQGADTSLPVIVATNSVNEDRKYILGDLEKKGLCTLVEEDHIDRDFIAHVFYYGWRLITGDWESFLRYRFREVMKVYEEKCREKSLHPYEEGANGLKPLAVSIGGDNYCYPEMIPDLILAHSVFRKKGFETMLWGCSIEPDSMRNPDLLQDINAYDRIYARESITYNALLNAGIPADKITLRQDPAFELQRAEIQLPEWFKKGNTIGINLSPMIQERESKKGIVRENYRNFVEFILEKTDQNIALIPHVVWSSSDDRQTLQKLYDDFKNSGRVFMVDDAPAEVLKGYIANCSFFVGARTHSTIAAYSSGVPTLVMGYSVKSRGIATDLFGSYENYVIPVQEIEDPFALVRSYEWIRSNRASIGGK
ncbi:polysaccharide pyruvyl transferase family protein [Butyrivibrio sp. FCS014]|uniref:polysaccharide pyruvyl transferase family protein n=1 Tax=Butyrivibrio sp. FCS014 TaxID=1408304 RepID=UPI000463D5CE|nr:polysaccharide pyruvyl transferase family protein [Butyrivibrio sp. FCS014]